MSKLPHIDTPFWIMKICATTLGETAGDLLSMTLQIGYAASSLLLISTFGIALGAQMLSTTYRPFIYWLVILTTSTAGTTISDYMDRTLKLGYAQGSAILAILLAAVLTSWHFSIGSLSVDNIRTRKAEIFYWIAILCSNTLGTALGDFLADSSGLGFGGGALLIGSLLAIILALHFFTRASKMLLFWLAFVLTRPFGATLGDLMTKATDNGGLGMGTIRSSLVLASILVISISLTTLRRDRAATPV